jgi:hypothetical protein
MKKEATLLMLFDKLKELDKDEVNETFKQDLYPHRVMGIFKVTDWK